MYVTKEESDSPKKLSHRIHGAFETSTHGRRTHPAHHQSGEEDDGLSVDTAAAKLKREENEASSPASPGSGQTIELTAMSSEEQPDALEQVEAIEVTETETASDEAENAESNNNDAVVVEVADSKTGEPDKQQRAGSADSTDEDEDESTTLLYSGGFKRLASLVDNSQVSPDENVSLIAAQVVGLREHMVSLQGRLVPLFRLTTADYRLADDEDDDEDRSCCSKCCGKTMDVVSWPWKCVFKVRIVSWLVLSGLVLVE